MIKKLLNESNPLDIHEMSTKSAYHIYIQAYICVWIWNWGRRWKRTGIGLVDFIDFIRVKPDLSFAALEDAGGEPLL